MGFSGLVVHSTQFKVRLDDIMRAVKPLSDTEPGTIVVVGGGKSAQESAFYSVSFFPTPRLMSDSFISVLRRTYAIKDEGSPSYSKERMRFWLITNLFQTI
jgi:hypothetical protein